MPVLGGDVVIDARTQTFNTPLHLAAMNGNLNAVELLLRYDADIYAINNDKRTALYLARRWGHRDVVNLLMDERRSRSKKVPSQITSKLTKKLFAKSRAVRQKPGFSAVPSSRDIFADDDTASILSSPSSRMRSARTSFVDRSSTLAPLLSEEDLKRFMMSAKPAPTPFLRRQQERKLPGKASQEVYAAETTTALLRVHGATSHNTCAIPRKSGQSASVDATRTTSALMCVHGAAARARNSAAASRAQNFSGNNQRPTATPHPRSFGQAHVRTTSHIETHKPRHMRAQRCVGRGRVDEAESSKTFLEPLPYDTTPMQVPWRYTQPIDQRLKLSQRELRPSMAALVEG